MGKYRDFPLVVSIGMCNFAKDLEINPVFNSKKKGRIMKTRTIWRNDNYDEWKDACIKQDWYMDEDELTYERYCDNKSVQLDNNRANLDIYVDGVIVCFAVLGLWNGKHNGGRRFGTKVSNILSSECDYVHWYCDRYNVRCTASHHDGTNTYLYRVAEDEESAIRLVNAIAHEGMDEETFMRRTKSLRPYVAKVYGW